MSGYVVVSSTYPIDSKTKYHLFFAGKTVFEFEDEIVARDFASLLNWARASDEDPDKLRSLVRTGRRMLGED